MAKGQYHINDDNRRLPCSAEHQCKFASNAPHFDTPAEADSWLELEALSRHNYDMALDTFGEDGLSPEIFETLGVTPWTLYSRDPENYPYPGDPAELLEVEPDKPTEVPQETPKVESTANLAGTIGNVSFIDIDLNVPSPPAGNAGAAEEPAQPISMATLEEAIDNFHVVDIDIAPPPAPPVETEQPAQEEPAEHGRDSAGWLDPDTGQFALDFDVSSMRIARPVYDLDDDRYWEPETDAERIKEALAYAGWDEKEVFEVLEWRRNMLEDLEAEGNDVSEELKAVEYSPLTWITRNFDKPLDEEEAERAQKVWAETPQGRGRVKMFETIDPLGQDKDEADYGYVVEFDIMSPYLPEDGELLSSLPQVPDGDENYPFREPDAQFAGSVVREKDNSITKYLDADGYIAINVSPNSDTVTQRSAIRRYGSEEDAVMYRAYRWDAQEREQLRDVYEDLSQDPENAHLELTAPQKDALNSLRKLQYQSVAVSGVMDYYIRNEQEDDKYNALVALQNRLGIEGDPTDPYFANVIVEGLKSGKYKMASDTLEPTLDDIVPGDPEEDGVTPRLRVLRGRSARGGSYTDMAQAVARRSYLPNVSTTVNPADVSQAETLAAAFAGRATARRESLTYKRSNMQDSSLLNSANGFEEYWWESDDASRSYDFVMTYKDESGDTRFAYAPQGNREGTLDVVHLPKEATFKDADGLEYPDPYFLKAARAEYFFGGAAFKPGDLENIVVNDDSSTTSKYDLKLW